MIFCQVNENSWNTKQIKHWIFKFVFDWRNTNRKWSLFHKQFLIFAFATSRPRIYSYTWGQTRSAFRSCIVSSPNSIAICSEQIAREIQVSFNLPKKTQKNPFRILNNKKTLENAIIALIYPWLFGKKQS